MLSYRRTAAGCTAKYRHMKSGLLPGVAKIDFSCLDRTAKPYRRYGLTFGFLIKLCHFLFLLFIKGMAVHVERCRRLCVA